MSFYGKVTYYLSEAFRTQQYSNAGASNFNNHVGTYGGPYTFTPLGKNDVLQINTGNGWLKFGSSQDQTNQLYVWHKLLNETPAIPGEDTTTLKAEKVASASSTTDLSFEDIITVPQIVFDDAGHLTSESTVVAFKLPTNPGVLDLDSIKNRLAALEEAVTGQHGDSGGGGSGSGDDEIPLDPETGETGQPGYIDPVETVDNPLTSRIESLERHIDSWKMSNDQGTSYVSQNWLEQKGIGTTLHELLVLLGLENAETDQVTNQTFYSDIAIANAFPIYNSLGVRQVLPAISTAYTSADNARLASSQLKTCIQTMLNTFKRKEMLSEDEYNQLYAYVES